MALPEFSLRQLLEAGVHFGHQTQRWNPRMVEFIYGERNGIHIIDLTQTVPMLDAALNAVRETAARGGRLLFVGTKRQAQRPVAEAAERCAQYYMNHRWLGGTLTNWKTVSQSINRLNAIDAQMAEGSDGLTKRERLSIERDRNKLQASLGGIREMGGLPEMLFVVDVNKEDLAIAEAKKLNIPVVAIVDTNCSPEGIDYVIPGNDDAARAIALFCDLVANAALDGMSEQMDAAGIDLGEMEEAPVEEALAEEPAIGNEAASETLAAEDASLEKPTVKDKETAANKKAAKTKAPKEKVVKEKAAKPKTPKEKAAKSKATKEKAAKPKATKEKAAKAKAAAEAPSANESQEETAGA